MEYAANEDAAIAEIVRGFLAQQARVAAEQNRPLRRGTHAKGICTAAFFEVFDVAQGRDAALAARLARGLYAKPGRYPATVRFGNSNPGMSSDWQTDVRSLSFAVQLGAAGDGGRQDYSLQSGPTLPFNDVHAFVVYAKVVGAPNEATALGSLPHDEQLVYTQTKLAVMQQQRQPVHPYQQLRYWSNVPFRHGSEDVVKYSAIPAADNPACALAKDNPNALQDELIRHLNEDSTASVFSLGLQFLDVDRMTWQGKHHEAPFWIENASIEWPEAQAPFHTVGRLTLLKASQLPAAECEPLYIDVNGNSLTEHAPVGGINRARWHAEVASRKARMGA